MGTPTNRTPVRVARGSTTALNTGLSDIQEGEIVWDTTLNKLQVKEGSALEDHTVDTSTLAPKASPQFTGIAGFSGDGVLINNDLKLHIDAANDLNYISNTGSGSNIHDLILSVKPARYIQLETDDGSGTKETLAKFQGDGAAELYYNGGTAKLETTAGGVTINGDITAEDITAGANNTLTADGQFTSRGQINLAQSGNSVQSMTMSTSGLKMMTGSPYVNRDVFEIGYSDIKLYGNDVLSLTAAETGVTIPGTLTVSGNLTVGGTTTEINSRILTVDDKNIEIGAVTEQTGQTGTLVSNSPTDYVTVASTAGYLVGASLTKESGTGVFGNGAYILSIDSETQFSVSNSHQTAGALTFTVGGATDLTADGGGIILKSTTNNDKKIIWDNTTDSWDFNQNIEVSGTVTDSKGDVRKIPENAKTTNYTLVATDAGKHIKFTPGDANQALTVPDSVFSAGDAVTIVNNSANNLAITKGTNMYNAADATNANRTLAGRGMATLLFTAADTCYISGAGLT